MRLWLNTVGEVMKCGSEIISFPVPRTPYKFFFLFFAHDRFVHVQVLARVTCLWLPVSSCLTESKSFLEEGTSPYFHGGSFV